MAGGALPAAAEPTSTLARFNQHRWLWKAFLKAGLVGGVVWAAVDSTGVECATPFEAEMPILLNIEMASK